MVVVRLNWEKNFFFLEFGLNDINSGFDEIFLDGVILFVMGWLEIVYVDIVMVFEGLNMVIN